MLDLLLLFFLVVFIANKLFSILGQADSDTINKSRGNDTWAANLFKRAQEAHRANVERTDEGMKEIIGVAVISPMEAMLTPVDRDNLKLLQDAEPSFDLEKFITGVRQVFVMITEAICNRNKDILRYLLAGELYKELNETIENMENQNYTLRQHIVAMRKIDIEEIVVSRVDDRLVGRIDVAITNQQTRVVYDKDSKVIEGTEEKVELVTSHWSFIRNIGSNDVIWLLQKM